MSSSFSVVSKDHLTSGFLWEKQRLELSFLALPKSQSGEKKKDEITFFFFGEYFERKEVTRKD